METRLRLDISTDKNAIWNQGEATRNGVEKSTKRTLSRHGRIVQGGHRLYVDKGAATDASALLIHSIKTTTVSE